LSNVEKNKRWRVVYYDESGKVSGHSKLFEKYEDAEKHAERHAEHAYNVQALWICEEG